MTICTWRRETGAGGGCVAGLALALLVLLAAARPSAAQDQPVESVPLPYNHQPLALAYVAATYVGSPSGRSSEFSSGKLAPGESVVARFLPRAGLLLPWEGMPFGLYKGTGLPGFATRLGVTATGLGIGIGKPLDLRLYVFLPPERLTSSLRLLTFESDAWKTRQDTFAVLSDTTFVLTGPMGPKGPVSSDGQAGGQRGNTASGQGPPGYGGPGYGKGPGSAPGRDDAARPGGGYGYDSRPKPGPGYGYDAGPKSGPGYGKIDTGVTESIACVNKRSAPPGSRSLSCADGTGEVIEDPLSGEPALLMYSPGGPPQWLKSVPTEICIEEGKQVPNVVAPVWGNDFRVAFAKPEGRLLCTRAALGLDYVMLRQSGIEIDGVKHRRLGRRSDKGAGWRLLAEPPSKQASGVWLQRIVVVSPGPPSVASAPKPGPLPAPKTPAPDSRAIDPGPPSTFAVILDEWRWKLPLSKLWYGPLPAGSDASQAFKCESGVLTLGTAKWSKDKLTEASSVSVSTVFKIPPALRLDVTQPSAKLQSVSKGLILLGESSGGIGYCGIAMPKSGSSELEGKLQQEEPPAPPPVISVDLVLQREGPAVLSIEKVSQGKITKLADLDAPSLTKTVQWSAGDKLRVRPVDPDFQRVSAVKVDGATVTVADDKSVEIALTEQTRTVAIETALRPVSGFLTVATPQGGVELVIDGGKTAFPPDAQPKRMWLRGVKLGEEVTVEPKDSDRFSVTSLTLRGGGSPRTVAGATFKFERGDLPGGKLDLRVDVELKANTLVLPAELVLKPVVHLGKRQLAFSSCKVTLAGLPAGEFVHERDGRTRVKVGTDKRGRIGASYRVEVGGTANVCKGFEGEAVPAEKLAALATGTELTIPVRRPSGRAFVGILSWPLAPEEDEGNLRAALKALVDTFDAGANEGRYLWGAIYAPDGKRLVAGESADYTPMEVFSPERLGRFKAGGSAPRYEEAVKRVLADVADLEATVDLMVVASVAEGTCRWSSPFTSAATRGGRSALVRVIKATPGQPSDPTSRARLCDVGGDKGAVGMAVEVAVDPSVAGGASDRLLREALEAAAKSLAAPVPFTPDAEPKAK